MQDSAQTKINLGSLASRKSKRRLKAFLWDVRELLGPEHCRLFATGNTYRYLTNGEYYGRLSGAEQLGEFVDWANHLDLCELREGPDGGVVQLAGMVVDGECETVIFFTDPEDWRFSSPENGALLRICNVLGTKLLLNAGDARFWAWNELQNSLNTSKRWARADMKPRPLRDVGVEPGGPESGRSSPRPERETLALIAHNQQKEEMFLFAMRHEDRLRRFARIICTGQTGVGIERFTRLHNVLKMRAGPFGGDVQIANEVLGGTCQHVLFFMDPMTSHPHYEDIHLMMNICSLPDVRVTFRMNKTSASDWIQTLSEASRAHGRDALPHAGQVVLP